MTWSDFFKAALNRVIVISDDSSNSSIVLGLHSGKNPQRAVLFKTDCNLAFSSDLINLLHAGLA